MTILTIRVKIRPNKRREFLQTVLALAKELQKEQRCLNYHTSQDIEDENMFYFVTRWQTRDELETYFRTRNFNVLLGAMHILSETSEMTINNVSHTAEMETIQALRRRRIHTKCVPHLSISAKHDSLKSKSNTHMAHNVSVY
jgi:quinol monooxygenase YgiN